MKTLICAAALAVAAGAASASIQGETAQFAGFYTVDYRTGVTTFSDASNSTRATTIYSNTASAPNFGVSSTDLNSTWGDKVTTTGTGGPVTSQQYTLFNSGTSLGTLLTATVDLLYFDGGTNAFINGFSGNINFGPGGLAAGFFSIITFTGLDGLNMNLPTTNIIMTQKVTAKTGLANRLGIASLNPVNIGSSGDEMYIDSTTIGPAGYYTFANGPAQPGYQIDLVPAPGALALMGLGGLMASRRRR
ncbi:MAG: PEP-CTERM sorting domain-containing protein [Phycisphaeraceae bacterium]|nr:PEP-CTERM sorting domain-containing protein [Phycisphaerae bacterium]MBX3393035.1 PEP-CTERM sorting domain-containing protein [Phycisphaeraceae bacterium]HRJ50148.1 PEP-CTERM sorting domain-containing protein [Phycisphaerales bacterium]